MTVNLSMFAGVGAQIFDSNGVPLAGGKIFSYQAGTTTPQATYTTSAGNIAHTNPIILDSAGRVPSGGEIWLVDGQSYKFVVNTSTDVLIATYDNVTGNGGGILASLAAPNGATLVGFTGFKSQVGTVADLADDDGSDWIGFKQAGTNAVARSAQDKMRDIIDVRDFGADPTGATDSSSAITAAINAAIAVAPATVNFSGGTYLCNSVLGPFTCNDITLDLNSAILNFANVTGVTVSLIQFTGTIASAVSLTSNAVSGAKTVACASTSFTVGDMVLIRSNAIWDSTRTNTKIGELNFVETIPGSTSLTTTLDLQSSYTTADSAAIQKITPVKRITIKNGTILGPAANDELIGIRISYGDTCLIENIKSYDVDQKHVRLDQCVYTKVINCHFQESNNDSQAYGISFADATQDCSAVNNTFVDVRHSLSTNNAVNTSYGITRRILFMGNNVSDSAKATGGSGGDAIDTHAGSEQISIINNIVNSASNHGINVEGRSAVVSGNQIFNTEGTGINCRPSADGASAFIVTDNYLLDVDGYGIRLTLFVTDMASCVVANNRVISKLAPIGLSRDTTQKFIRASVTGNIAQISTSGTSQIGLEVDAARVAVTGNTVVANNAGMTLTECSNSIVSGNSVQLIGDGSLSANGWGIRLSGTTEYSNVTGNTCLDSSSGITTTGVVFASGGVVTYSAAIANVTQDFNTNVNISAGTGVISANNI
jgi:parallel beta-helix repeat protein